MSGPGSRFYDENEAEEILRLAARDGTTGRMDKDRLLSMAAELGISPEAVARAEAELVRKKEVEAKAAAEAQERAEFRVHRRRDFWTSIGSFFSLNAGILAIWYFTGAGYFWPFWVMLGTGSGVFPRAFHLFGRGSERDYQRWRRRRHGIVEKPREDKIRGILDELAHRDGMTKLLVIREIRERTGVGLADAKEAVEEYAAGNDNVVW